MTSGKSTVARVLARVFVEVGVCDGAVTMHKDDIVGEYVGQTTRRCREFLQNNLGKVVVFDEAHQFFQSNQDTYAREAAAVINEFLEEHKGE